MVDDTSRGWSPQCSSVAGICWPAQSWDTPHTIGISWTPTYDAVPVSGAERDRILALLAEHGVIPDAG